jgi:hypothetical protein
VAVFAHRRPAKTVATPQCLSAERDIRGGVLEQRLVGGARATVGQQPGPLLLGRLSSLRPARRQEYVDYFADALSLTLAGPSLVAGST